MLNRDMFPLEAATLIDDLLAEQRELTAVEKFSRSHEAGGAPGNRYRDLLPASPPAPGQQFAFEVALDQCSGCKACVTACHSLNGLDEHETWRSVGELVSTNPRAPFRQAITTACHHCAEPACLLGCPVLAYDKDPSTGIVRHLDDQCIGCQYCVMMCPYDAPKYLPSRGIVRKCDMCSSRLAAGEAPACVQACPNEAISIALVETGKIRGNYRKLDSILAVPPEGALAKRVLIDFRDSSKAHFQWKSLLNLRNDFLPHSPNPAITLPTTRYVTQRALPAQVEAADAHDARPSKAHLPLTVMLVFSQLGVGLAMTESFFPSRSRPSAFAAFVITVLAIIAGTLHLGQPFKAWRSFLGWRNSWLSRELIAFGAFLGTLGAHCAIFHPLWSILSSFIGSIAVTCSAMVYVATRRPFWMAPMTFAKFLGTTILLGSASAFWLSASGSTVRLVAGLLVIHGTLFKLGIETRIFKFVAAEHDRHEDALSKTALLFRGPLSWLWRVRVVCAMIGGVLLPAVIVSSKSTIFILPSAALLLCIVGELIERHLFFVAEAAPKMPGGAV